MKAIFTLLIGFITLTAFSQSTFMKTYPYWYDANGCAVFEDSDGYVIAGNGHEQYGGAYKMTYIMKVNFMGDTLWTKIFLADIIDRFFTGYARDASGNSYLVMTQNNGKSVYKFDPDWNLIYNGDFGLGEICWISILADDNLLVMTLNRTGYVPHKIDPVSFNQIWSGDTIQDLTWDGSFINSVSENTNGELAIVLHNYLDFIQAGSVLFHMSATGSLLHKTDFTYALGSTIFDGDNLLSLKYFNTFTNYNALLRIQPDGTIVSIDTINVNNYGFRNFVKVGNDLVLSGIYHTPETDFNEVAVACVKDNQVIWTQHYNDSIPQNAIYPFDIKKTSDNGYLIFGYSEDPYVKPFLVKIGTVLGVPEIKTTTKYLAFPNPASDYVIIPCSSGSGTIELYNSSGKLISREPISSKNYRLDVRDLPRGYYIVKVKEGLQVEVISVILGE